MKNIGVKIIFALLYLFVSYSLVAKEYKINKKKSSVSFTACCHLLVLDVDGVFKDYKAKIVFDKNQKIKSLSAKIKVASVETDKKKRDKHLQESDFFDAKKYPEIIFKTKKIKYNPKSKIVGTGILTIKGISKKVSFSGELVSKSKTKMVFKAKSTVNRKDFKLGSDKIKNKVTISLNITLER